MKELMHRLNTKELFRQRLRRARSNLGMTQQEVADKALLPVAQYAFYEQGNRMPTVENLVSLCTALKVSADWLIGLTK